ncbi:MAG: hypothetical protein LBD75_01630, partial [Candidatus Peribacteria bacterium]|nr:hypothetical protein [Candidatus Peribacteria bacterium]
MLKQVSYRQYPLHIHFSNPMYEFITNELNKKEIQGVLNKRLEPFINSVDIEKSESRENFVEKVFLLSKTGVTFEIREQKLYASGYSLIISKILECILKNLPENAVDTRVIRKLLGGGMTNVYYITGQFGDKLVDELEMDIHQNKYDGSLIYLREQLVSFFYEDITKYNDTETYKKILSKIASQQLDTLTPKELCSLEELSDNKE